MGDWEGGGGGQLPVSLYPRLQSPQVVTATMPQASVDQILQDLIARHVRPNVRVVTGFDDRLRKRDGKYSREGMQAPTFRSPE